MTWSADTQTAGLADSRNVHRALEELGDVEDLDVFFPAARFDGVVQHDHAVGAGRRHDVRARGDRLVGALQVDALQVDARALGLLEPHPGSSGSAAEAALSAAPDLDRAGSGHRSDRWEEHT